MEIDNKKLIKIGILTVIIIIADFFAYTKAIPFILEISKVSYGNINIIKTILPHTIMLQAIVFYSIFINYLTENEDGKTSKEKKDV